MSTDSFVRVPGIDETGSVHVDNAQVTTAVGAVQRQRVEVYSGETLPVSSASDTVLGATTDAAVSTDTTGTVSGKLRGIVKILAAVYDSTWGRLKTTTRHDLDAVSPFGDLVVAPITPLIQLDFEYGINSQIGAVTVANSATGDTNGGRLRLQTGTNAAGSVIYATRRPARYRPGQGIIARFTPVFTTGVANSTQIMGAGSSTDGYFFGFNGTTFGILHRNSGSDTWTAQTAWNGDKCDGTGPTAFTWNKTFGNVCMIRYPFLGYGDITFWVQDQTTARWILCHTIRYTNTTATLQLANPSLFFYAQAINSGSTSNTIMYCGSVGFLLCGERSFITTPRWAYDNNKATITAETNIFSLRNATTYNGVTNRALIRLTQVSFGVHASNAVAVLRFRIGATVGGAPSFTTINGTTADGGVTITNGNSVASVDTAGTTATGGTYIFNISSNGTNGTSMDLTAYNLFVAPGETLTISGFSTSSATISASLNWQEDI